MGSQIKNGRGHNIMPFEKLTDVASTWDSFLLHAVLAQHYKIAGTVSSGITNASPNPVLEEILPSLLFVRLGALFDDVLDLYITENTLPFGKPYRADFNGRVSFLDDRSSFADIDAVHSLRLKRNRLAHEFETSCTWTELNVAIQTIQREFEHLGLAGKMSKYEFYAEKSAAKESSKGYMCSYDCCYGIKRNDVRALEVTWQVHVGGIMKDEVDS